MARRRVTEVVAAGGGVRNPTLRGRLAALGAGRWRLRTTDDHGLTPSTALSRAYPPRPAVISGRAAGCRLADRLFRHEC
ncbi:hypothetical protein [Micromonospora sp. IBHARD004]|uniref:hypothetical protein n=1 Tax=Micromonospora sp. IBHARD004 TaxID=3457764 RepID=UPI0040594A6E